MITLEYRFISVLKSSEKGDIQLVKGDDGRLYVRRYRELPQELFKRLRGVSCPFTERLAERSADENGTFFTSEYIEGAPACEHSFTEKEAVQALTELCAAIKALHNAGIIHRDIKPGNIIRGTDGHIRLIDFDSARLEKASRSRDTRQLGTAGFAPPEQYGFMQTDSRSDIYSFGVTMRELLGGSADKPRFRRIISRCTRFDPERRYSDIGAVERAIKRASLPIFLPLATAGVIFAAGALLVWLNAPPAPNAQETLSQTGAAASTEAAAETEEYAAADAAETREAVQTKETGETGTPAAESGEPLPAAEPTQEQTEAANTLPPEQEPVPEITEPAAEAPENGDSTTETPPTVTETAEPERAPNVLSDSVNPNKITYETVQDEDGLFADVFDYVFYDDPAVHGEWQLCGLLSASTDFTAITAGQLAFSGTPEYSIWQYLTVSPDGSYYFRQPDNSFISRMPWTNGYYIFFENNRSFVRRMFEVTVDGTEYLMFEQKPTSNSHPNIPHRFLVYIRAEN